LKILELDVNSEGLKETPRRVAKLYIDLFEKKEFEFTTFEAPAKDLVTVLNIDFTAFCEHHLLPFFGKVHIGYVPNKKIAGLSKFSRAVEYFTKGITIQEQVNKNILDFLEKSLDPFGLIVVSEAQHTCMICRGVKKEQSITKIVSVSGIFAHNASLKAEFLSLI
jgi:GTP cyclohydrolase I